MSKAKPRSSTESDMQRLVAVVVLAEQAGGEGLSWALRQVVACEVKTPLDAANKLSLALWRLRYALTDDQSAENDAFLLVAATMNELMVGHWVDMRTKTIQARETAHA